MEKSEKQARQFRAAFLRALLGFPAGALLGIILFAFFAPDVPGFMETRFGFVALASAFAGAILGAVAGGFELRGKARASFYGCLAGTIAGILIGPMVGRSIDPPLEGLGLMLGTLAGALLGALAGRIYHGGRVTIGEIMIVIAIIALLLGALTALERRT